MTALIADTAMMWTCKCGVRVWHHYEHCSACGEERPPPAPAADPSTAPQPEMPGYT